MKILITGSHGFVGTNLIETLSSEHEIIRWDVRSDDALPDCDAVIHLAGKAHDVRCKKEDGRVYFEVNTELTKKIYDAFLRSKAKKFIFFSSIKAKDNDTPYAKSKFLAEQYIQEKFRDESLEFRDNTSTSSAAKRVYILRPCMIHGKGVKGNLPLLFKYVKKGWPWPLATFENQRSYASMGNVAYVVNELLKKDVVSGTYNICDDESLSTNNLILLMSESLGRKVEMMKIPKGIVRMCAKIGDLIHLPLNMERLEKLTEDNVVDNSDIKIALGIQNMPIKTIDGLKYTINEMIKRG